MSRISMEWLGGPIVLNLNEDEIMADLEENWTPQGSSDDERTRGRSTDDDR